jgi:signal transduction histidine kinase/ActR/RegA family two-component response regulator
MREHDPMSHPHDLPTTDQGQAHSTRLQSEERKSSPSRLPNLVVLIAGGVSGGLGLVGLIGWYLHNVALVQVVPAFAPIQYNTALCFLVGGVSLLALARRLPRLTAVGGTITTVVGLMTLSEYLFDVNLGIDQFLMPPVVTALQPERMAPNTALSFALFGMALVMMSRTSPRKQSLLIIGPIGAIVLALGLVACIGYLTGLATYNWGQAILMTAHTAVGLIVVGSGVIAYAWQVDGAKEEGRPRRFPILIGVTVLAMTLCLWQALIANEHALVEQALTIVTASIHNEFITQTESRILALTGLARHWEQWGKPTQEVWETDAELYVKHYPGFQAVAWVDPSKHVRWLVPAEGNEAMRDLYLAFEEERRRALELAQGSRQVTATRVFDLIQGGQGFHVYIPIFRDKSFDGYMVGIFRVQELLDAILGNVAGGYALAVYVGETQVYSRRNASDRVGEGWSQEVALGLYGVTWRVQLWPTPALLAMVHSALPEIVLIVGLLTAMLLATAVHLAQIARRRAVQVDAVNRELQAEIAERKRQQEALYQREKLAAMSTLLAGVTHELNNPLAIVMMEVELLGEEVENTPLAVRTKKIFQAAQRCVHIIQNFLALVRERSPERTPVQLNAVVEAVMEMLAYPLKVDNIAVHLQLADELPVLAADANQLHQVLLNLVTNAHQALRETPPPRQLTITTQYDVVCRQITLKVADTGSGIPLEMQARIFEPFFTTKPPGVGTGLGLSLCQGIIEGHGGTIAVESQPGHGAIFRIQLPVTPAPMPVPLEAPKIEDFRSAAGKSILVVDDESGIASALAYLLRRNHHEVETAANGRIALQKLQQRAYDLILSDIRMPDLDGPGLYQELEHHYPQLLKRIIFLTGDTLSPETKAFLEQARVFRLSKPFTAAEVRRAVQRALQTS